MTIVVVDSARGAADSPRFQAMLVCSVLAEHPEVLSSACPETALDRVRNLVDRVLMHESTGHVLAWRQRVPARQWDARWDHAREAAMQFYSHIPGADSIPALVTLDSLGADAHTSAVPQQLARS